MKVGLKRVIVGALGAGVLCLMGLAPARGQTTATEKAAEAARAKAFEQAIAAASQGKVVMSDEVFPGIQVLKGLPLDEFFDTMGFFASSLSMTCTDCHSSESGGDWLHYIDETPRMTTARKMVLMMNKINQENFGGAKMVTCFTCHRFDANTPQSVPSIMLQYSVPPPDDPEYVVATGDKALPSADQIFDKYFQALGGAQKLAGVTSMVVKGTYEGYDTGHEQRPVEVYSKAPAQRTTIVHLRGEGDKVWNYDGSKGWIASPDKPVPLLALTGSEEQGLRIDALLAFPQQIKSAYPTWKVGSTAIDDNEVYLVQGTAPGRTSLKLFFDKKTGLLLRQVRYDTTKIGTVPEQVDYSDYRTVGNSGVKVPYQVIHSWTDGQSTVLVTDVQLNAQIAPAKLSRPEPAKVQETAEAR